MTTTPYDVIIIGTGAGGGTLAYRLAASGLQVLLLERGDYVPREKDNWSARAVNVAAKYNTTEIWRDGGGKELHPHTNYYVGSFFPSSGAVNPALTIMANALRVGDHLLGRLGAPTPR